MLYFDFVVLISRDCVSKVQERLRTQLENSGSRVDRTGRVERPALSLNVLRLHVLQNGHGRRAIKLVPSNVPPFVKECQVPTWWRVMERWGSRRARATMSGTSGEGYMAKSEWSLEN